MFIFLLQVSAVPEHIWQLTKNLYVNRVSDYELRKTTFPYDEYTDKFNKVQRVTVFQSWKEFQSVIAAGHSIIVGINIWRKQFFSPPLCSRSKRCFHFCLVLCVSYGCCHIPTPM